MKVGVLGGSGYAGSELLRLAIDHPEMEVVTAMASSAAGRQVADHTPALAAAYPDLVLDDLGEGWADRLDGLDVVFLALPHGGSESRAAKLQGRVRTLIDLGSDFRLRDPAAYPRWYGRAHGAPEMLDQFVYGLPELHRDELRNAQAVAVPGCYPTAAALALAPFARARLLDPEQVVIVDAASGVSGAGRAASDRLHFGQVDASFTAYGLLEHRHTPEMEQELGVSVLFTPHLAPMSRGILATCYARPRDGLRAEEVAEALHASYDAEPFVTVVDNPPATKATTGSNSAHVMASLDPRTGLIVVLCALDNLVKGAAGQAIQAMNVVRGLPETLGLPLAGLYP